MTDDRPLVLINDEALLDEVLRLAAAVGCEVERVPDAAAAESRWAGASLVIVDEDVLTAGEAPPRRDGVVLVCKSALPAESWRAAYEAGVSKVIVLPDSESALISVLADIAEGPHRGDGRVLAVLGGCGGAGASVFAAATGLAVCRDGADALLLDCDPLGGGADLVLGMERVEGLRWPGLRNTSGRLSMTDLAAALPGRSHGGGTLSVLSCDRQGGGAAGPAGPTTEAVTAVLAAARRTGSTVICDVARHLGTGAAAAVANADLVVVVLPAEVRACAAAAGVIRLLGRHTERARIVVRGPGPDGLGGRDIASTLGLPLAAEFRSERALPRAIERGVFTGGPRGSLATAASEVLAALASVCAEPVGS